MCYLEILHHFISNENYVSTRYVFIYFATFVMICALNNNRDTVCVYTFLQKYEKKDFRERDNLSSAEKVVSGNDDNTCIFTLYIFHLTHMLTTCSC